MRALLDWAEQNRSAALDIVRIYLGVGLFVRGLTFLAEPSSFAELLPGGEESPFATATLAHYVGLSHLAGGLLLALGMLTRLAAAVQVPSVAGAAFLVHLPATGLTGQSFAFAAFVFALLMLFVLWGSGTWSLDHAAERWSEQQKDAEAQRVEEIAETIRSRPRKPLAPSRPAVAPPTESTCTCGDRDRNHVRVRAKREYGGISGLRFITGTHARPTRVVFRCKDCDGVVEVAETPEELEALRYERIA